MSKTHDNYWENRSKSILAYVDRTDIDIFAEIQKVYASSAVDMQKELFAFVTKYADNNAMSYQEALQRLRGQDLSDYRTNAQKYREQAEKDPELLKRLNEQYAASKVTRMDALNLELAYRAGMMNGVLQKSFEGYLKSTANYVYKKAIGGHSGALNEPALQELIRTPFNGADYSQQLWGNTDKLVEDIREVFKRGFVRGDDVRTMAQDLATKYNVARSRAQTLIRTDGTSIINRASIRRYQDAGLEYYRILVQLDNRTTQICRRIEQEDRRYRMDEFRVGVAAPPFHFNCRSTVIPDEEELKNDKTLEKGAKSENEHTLKESSVSTENKPETVNKQLFNNYKDAEQYAMKQGVQYADFSKMKPEWYNGIVEQLEKIPAEARPVVITDAKTLQKISGVKVSRKANSYYGVHFHLGGDFKRVNGETIQFRDGSWVGFNTTSFKDFDALEKAKIDVNQTYLEKLGTKWSMLTKAEETIAHEFGHVIDNYKNASDNWEWRAITKDWHENSGYDHLKSPSEAWADAIGAKWNGKKLPKEIDDYIKKYSKSTFGDSDALSGNR